MSVEMEENNNQNEMISSMARDDNELVNLRRKIFSTITSLAPLGNWSQCAQELLEMKGDSDLKTEICDVILLYLQTHDPNCLQFFGQLSHQLCLQDSSFEKIFDLAFAKEVQRPSFNLSSCFDDPQLYDALHPTLIFAVFKNSLNGDKKKAISDSGQVFHLFVQSECNQLVGFRTHTHQRRDEPFHSIFRQGFTSRIGRSNRIR